MSITPHTTKEFADGLNIAITKYYDDAMLKHDDTDYVGILIKNQEPTDKKTDILSGMAGFGYAVELSEDGDIFYDMIKERYDHTITQGVWALGFALTFELQLFDYKKRTKLLPKLLVTSIKKTIQLLGHRPLNLGFSGLTYGDGKTLFAIDHPNAPGIAGTFSNRAASGGTFAYSTLQSAIVGLKALTNDRGFPLDLTPDLVTIPQSLLFTGVEIGHPSAKEDPSTTQRAINVIVAQYPNLKILPDPWKTSTTAWELWAKERDPLTMLWRLKPDNKYGADEEKRRAWWTSAFCVATGVGDPRIAYGNPGA